jgi:glycosyltransferase involved in cell wall biosynthesis
MPGPKVTFYGHFSGWSSYPTVCKAIAMWLHGREVDLELCDLRPERLFDGVEAIPKASKELHRGVYERAQAQSFTPGPPAPPAPGVSLLFGFPAWASAVPRHEWAVGYHVGDVDRVPAVWVDHMNREDAILTPSQWCKLAFSRSGVRRPIDVVQHGVSSAFQPHGDVKEQLLLHFCSSRDPSRKGTLELLEAVRRVRPELERHGVQLRVHGDTFAIPLAMEVGEVLDWRNNDWTAPEQMAQRLATAALVVQPSRAEGFGMIPLEALACGTPVVATSCTGHAEHLSAETPGAVIVPTGKLEECGGARAPSVSPESVAKALSAALQSYPALAKDASDNVGKIRADWSWDAVLGRSSLMKALQYA